MSTRPRPFAASVAAISLGFAGALAAGAGLAGLILTSTVDLTAFGAFASFVTLAVPYAYGAAVALTALGLVVMIVANSLFQGRLFTAGLVLAALLAAVAAAAFLLAPRLPSDSLAEIVRGLAPLGLLPLAMLVLGSPYYRR